MFNHKNSTLRITKYIIIILCIVGFVYNIIKNGMPYNKGENALNFNTMTFSELANTLESLGISGFSEEIIKEIEETWSAYPDMVAHMGKTAILLTYVGHGNYDYDTGVWTPNSSQVYSFDVEVFDIERMYTLFLQGLSAINNNEFEISQVVEDTSKVNYEQGTGEQIISFCYNDTLYTYTARVDYDWFDTGFLNFMNEVLKTENNNKQLYFMGDGYQECFVFYCTKEWAEFFMEKTGSELYSVAR